MAKKNYLFAVQDSTGRELLSAVLEVEKVSAISATFDGTILAVLAGETRVAHTSLPGAPEGSEPFWLYRWEADDKLADPVRHPVKRL